MTDAQSDQQDTKNQAHPQEAPEIQLATIEDVRRNNIRKMLNASERGHMTRMAKSLGYKNASFFSQMVGATPTREVSDVTARRIEYVYNLPHLSLDDAHFQPPKLAPQVVSRADFVRMIQAQRADKNQSPDARPDLIKRLYPELVPVNPPPQKQEGLSRPESLALATESVRLVGDLCKAEGVVPDPEKFANLVTIVLADAWEHGKPRPTHIEMLVKLMR